VLQPVPRRERVCVEGEGGDRSWLRCTRTWQNVRLFDCNEHKIERTAAIASSSSCSDTHSRMRERLSTNGLSAIPHVGLRDTCENITKKLNTYHIIIQVHSIVFHRYEINLIISDKSISFASVPFLKYMVADSHSLWAYSSHTFGALTNTILMNFILWVPRY
jgi:hypothetical protein